MGIGNPFINIKVKDCIVLKKDAYIKFMSNGFFLKVDRPESSNFKSGVVYKINKDKKILCLQVAGFTEIGSAEQVIKQHDWRSYGSSLMKGSYELWGECFDVIS